MKKAEVASNRRFRINPFGFWIAGGLLLGFVGWSAFGFEPGEYGAVRIFVSLFSVFWLGILLFEKQCSGVVVVREDGLVFTAGPLRRKVFLPYADIRSVGFTENGSVRWLYFFTEPVSEGKDSAVVNAQFRKSQFVMCRKKLYEALLNCAPSGRYRECLISLRSKVFENE